MPLPLSYNSLMSASSLLLFQIVIRIWSSFFLLCCSGLTASNSNPSLLTFCFSFGDLLHHQVSFLLLQYTYYPHLYQLQLLPEVLPTCDNLMVDSLHLHEETSCLLNGPNSPCSYYLMLLPVHQNGISLVIHPKTNSKITQLQIQIAKVKVLQI